MSISTLVTTPVCRPRLSIEAFATLTTAGVIGAAWWMGSLGAGRQDHAPACEPHGRVTATQVEQATRTLRDATDRARYTAIAGSGYVAAKVGLPKTMPEFALAQAAAAEMEAARQDLARLCKAEP